MLDSILALKKVTPKLPIHHHGAQTLQAVILIDPSSVENGNAHGFEEAAAHVARNRGIVHARLGFRGIYRILRKFKEDWPRVRCHPC